MKRLVDHEDRVERKRGKRLEKHRQSISSEAQTRNDRKAFTTEQAFLKFSQQDQEAHDKLCEKQKRLENQLKQFKLNTRLKSEARDERKKIRHEEVSVCMDFLTSIQSQQKKEIYDKHQKILQQIKSLDTAKA